MTTPSHVEVLDPVDRWLHLGAVIGALGALFTGPLLRFPGAAEWFGASLPAAGFAHGALSSLALAAWGLHLVRVCLAWLDGRNPWGLVPRLSDLREAWEDLREGVGPDAPEAARGRYSYRERTPYGALQLALPLLCVTGWAVSHPGVAAGWIGAGGLVSVSGFHAALGLLTIPFLLWHVYFAHLQPAALYWNGAWLTGKVPWGRLEAMWPGWAREITAEVLPGGVEEPEAPSVQSLLEEGNRAAREGRYGEAAGAYEEALRLYPGYSQALYNLGVARARQGERARASEALERFLEQDPFSPVAGRARDLLTELRESADG